MEIEDQRGRLQIVGKEGKRKEEEQELIKKHKLILTNIMQNKKIWLPLITVIFRVFFYSFNNITFI